MADQTIVHYDLLAKYSKQFDHEEEILIHSLSELRQKAQMLESEWLGEAADKFFDEFYQEVLPGTERLRLAMQASSETIRKIMNIFDAAENESASYFRDGSLDEGSGGIDVSNLQFGDFRNLGGTPAGGGGIDVSNLDFGDFSNFGSGGPDGGGGGSQTDPGMQEKDGAFEPQEKEREQEQPENNETQSGGGGGGGGGSQSGQSDLNMGVGTGNQVGVEGNAGTEGGGTGGMQDHIYEGSSGSGGENNPEPNQAGDAGGGQNQPEGGSEFIRAAGMVGGVGAAAGAAARAAKGKKNDD